MAGAQGRVIVTGLAVLAGYAALCGEARADFKLCNRMSYVLEAAVALESKGKAATRGWYHLDPGQCRVAVEGPAEADQFYVHVRVAPVYGAAPMSPDAGTNFCVGTGSFVIPEARNCRYGQAPAPFIPIRPSESEGNLVAYLAEDSEYTDTQARDAGIQRLLVVAGYDANPIDGIRGEKTDVALVQFLRDNNLPSTAAGRSDIFDLLIEIAQKPGIGFSWCNETKYPVMAAIGIEERGGLLARGWYRVEAGKCVRPDITGRPIRLYSYAEAVDPDGQPLKRGDKPLSWGGDVTICTRNVKFELSDRTDCAAKGLSSAGFAAVDLGGKAPAVVTFK